MDDLFKWMAPLHQKMDEKTVHLGFLAALTAYFCSLFFPWTTLPIVVAGHGGISASGWDEQAYLAVLPFAVVLLNARPKRLPIDLTVVGLCIMLAFAMLLVDNGANRTVWLTPLLVSAGSPAPFAIYGSTLATGYWFALASTIGLSFFSVLWTMKSAGTHPRQGFPAAMAAQQA